MTVDQLQVKLNEAGVDPLSYSLVLQGDGYPPDKYCLNHWPFGWQVYYSERGDKTHNKWFKEETEACEYFFKWVTSEMRG